MISQDVFPTETFMNGGAKLLQPDYDPRYKLLFRECDLEQGQAIVREGFKVIVISSLSPPDFEKLLEDSSPLGSFEPIFVVWSTQLQLYSSSSILRHNVVIIITNSIWFTRRQTVRKARIHSLKLSRRRNDNAHVLSWAKVMTHEKCRIENFKAWKEYETLKIF